MSHSTDAEASVGTPRWAKVFGAISIVVVILFVLLLVAGGGRHGPRRHTPSSVEEPEVQRP